MRFSPLVCLIFLKKNYSAFTRVRDPVAWMPVLNSTSSDTTQWILNPLNNFFQVHPWLLPNQPLAVSINQPLAFSTNEPLSPLTESESDTEIPPFPLEEIPPPFPSVSSLLASTVDFSAFLQVINTNFDPTLKENLTPPYPRDKDFNRYPLTQKERGRASKAVMATGLSQFSTIVHSFV